MHCNTHSSPRPQPAPAAAGPPGDVDARRITGLQDAPSLGDLDGLIVHKHLWQHSVGGTTSGSSKRPHWRASVAQPREPPCAAQPSQPAGVRACPGIDEGSPKPLSGKPAPTHLDRVGLSGCLLRDARRALQATLLSLLPCRPPGAGESPLPEHRGPRRSQITGRARDTNLSNCRGSTRLNSAGLARRKRHMHPRRCRSAAAAFAAAASPGSILMLSFSSSRKSSHTRS